MMIAPLMTPWMLVDSPMTRRPNPRDANEDRADHGADDRTVAAEKTGAADDTAAITSSSSPAPKLGLPAVERERASCRKRAVIPEMMNAAIFVAVRPYAGEPRRDRISAGREDPAAERHLVQQIVA